MPFGTKTLRQNNRSFLLSELSPDTAQAHRRLRFLLSPCAPPRLWKNIRNRSRRNLP